MPSKGGRKRGKEEKEKRKGTLGDKGIREYDGNGDGLVWYRLSKRNDNNEKYKIKID